MDARTKWPGGALQRADRAGLEMQDCDPAFHPEHRLNHRQMQAERMRQREAGIKRTKRSVLPGSKASGWKHTFNHGWERR